MIVNFHFKHNDEIEVISKDLEFHPRKGEFILLKLSNKQKVFQVQSVNWNLIDEPFVYCWLV